MSSKGYITIKEARRRVKRAQMKKKINRNPIVKTAKYALVTTGKEVKKTLPGIRKRAKRSVKRKSPAQIKKALGYGDVKFKMPSSF